MGKNKKAKKTEKEENSIKKTVLVEDDPELNVTEVKEKKKKKNLKTEDSDDESEQEQTLQPPTKKSKKNKKHRKHDSEEDSDNEEVLTPKKSKKGDKRKKKQEENIEDENEMAPPSKKSKKSEEIKHVSSQEDDEDSEEEDVTPPTNKIVDKRTKQEENMDSDDSDEDSEEDMVPPTKQRSKNASSSSDDDSEEDAIPKPTPQENGEGMTLFVGNLSFDCDEDAMMSFFNEGGFNPHQVRVITRDGRSKGFGYADFSSSSEAKKAMNSLVGQELCGREVRLDIANSTTPKDRTPRGGGRGRGTPGGGRGRGGSDRPPSSTLMAFNLSFDTEPYTLEEIFRGCNDVYLPKNRETGEKRGFGFIRFDDIESATKALKKFNYSDVDGREIELRYAEERGEGGGGGRGGGGGGFRGGRGGGGRGFRGGGRGGRGGGFSSSKAAHKGSIQEFKGQKITFD